jgi:hypothetical protein
MPSQPKEPKPQKTDAGLEDPRGETNSIKPYVGPAEKSREAGPPGTLEEEENTIRARRARILSGLGPGANPNFPQASGSASPTDSRAVPEHINARYIKVGSRYHFTNGDLAFKDRGGRLSTRLENTEVIRDLVAIAKEREWNDIALSGTERFRKDAWREAQLAGLSVRGYRPSELERAQLARLIAREREEGREPSLRPSAVPSEGATTRPTATVDAIPAGTRPSAQAPDRVHAGRLLDHGAANYQHDSRADLSYFVKIETPDGERTLWGKDLERALAQSLSGAKLGNEVIARQLGAKPVTVSRPVRDGEGRIVDRTQVQTHLNRWSVERTDFLKERVEVAEIVRDPSIDAKTAAAKRPELAGTYTELHAAKLVAQELYTHPADRERFITRVREAIADEIERGEPLSAPRLRTRAPGREAPRVLTPERAHERALN